MKKRTTKRGCMNKDQIEREAIRWSEGLPKTWQPIVRRAVREILATGATIFQVKDKFGQLRIYCDTSIRNEIAVMQIVNEAERSVERLP